MKKFYENKTVFITGHTGFKGAWMCKVLKKLGANVVGYSLDPPTEVNLYNILNVDKNIISIISDIRNLEKLKVAMHKHKPDIVIHMAAQPLVKDSYDNPVYTYETNVMGTVNICEAIRHCDSVKSFVNVTTDKVYKNNEWEWGYRESDYLNGYDPYSNSKSCSELVTFSYINSFLSGKGVSVSTCRAGNVIGGGDFAKNRIIPDCIRFAKQKKSIVVRNPYSTRPYQHVLEPIYTYLEIAMLQYDNDKYANSYNVGPDECDCVTTGTLVDLFCEKWGNGVSWVNVSENNAPHEANFLKLDCSRIKNIINWKPRWHIEEAVQKTVDWSKAYFFGENIEQVTNQQINEFFER